MTQDEKAKAYEMALEAARKELGVDRKEWEVVQRVLHNIFPELRESESEDERIRKKLYNTVMGTPNDSTWFDGTSKEAMLAWLEKQKEQKPVEWSERDEEVRKDIIAILEQFGRGLAVTTKEKRDKMVSWMRNLRPSWKPSEEQMRALEVAFRKDGDDEYRKLINSLYNDLKRL